MLDEIYKRLKPVPHLLVYKKEEIPEEYHYRSANGILPLELYTDIHWTAAEASDALNNEFTMQIRGKKRKFKIDNDHICNILLNFCLAHSFVL